MAILRVQETWQQALVFDVRKQTFIEGQNIPQELEFDEKYGEAYNYVLITEQNKGIATARINVTNPEYGKIERVAVIPTHQDKGFGRELITECENWILDLEISKSVITSQVKAVGFYEKIGYKADYSIQLESSIPIVYLEKELRKKVIK